MPPMMSGRSGSRRWRSKPWPTRNGRTGGFGAAATAGWCSDWTAAATTWDVRRGRRDGRHGEGHGWAARTRARALGAVEMGDEIRKREEEGAEAMAPLLAVGIARWPSLFWGRAR
jgi:hypothetical protein